MWPQKSPQVTQFTEVKGYKGLHILLELLAVLSWNLPATSWVDKVITCLQSLGGPGTTEVMASVTYLQPEISQKQKFRMRCWQGVHILKLALDKNESWWRTKMAA